MDKSRRFIHMETTAGDPVQVGEQTVRPISKALTLNLGRAGFVWNRPVAVEVEEDDHPVKRIPIVDVTRTAQVALLGASLAFGAITGLLFLLLNRSPGADQITSE